MASSSESWYYIACTDIQLKEESQGIGSRLYGFVNPSAAVTRLLQGELLSIKPKSYKGSEEVHGCAASDPSKTFKVKDSQVSYLTVKEHDIFVAIEKPSERWDLFCNKDALQVILALETDVRVWVSIPTERHSSGTTGSSCAEGIIKYIGAIEGKMGTFFGIELKESKGTGNGSYRYNRYFECKDNFGIFLPASHLNISLKKIPSVKIQQEERASFGEIYESDEVYMTGKNRKRVDGTVKWAKHTKDGFLLGIETKNPNESYAQFPEHFTKYGKLFKTHDYKNHSYLVLPAKSVQMERGTPVDHDHPDKESFQLVNHSDCTMDVSESLHSAASTVAKEENVSIKDVLNDQRKAAETVERNHEKVKAKEFGLSTQDIKSQTEEMQKFEQEKRAADDARWASEKLGVPPVSSYERPPGDSNRRKSEEDILRSHEGEDQPRTVYNRQQSEGASPKLQRKSRSPHSFSVGSLVQVHISDQDKPSYGTIRWIGPLLIQNKMEDIAGVELERFKAGIGTGSWKEVEYFKCDPGYGMFVVLSKLQPDDRYPVHVKRGHNPLEFELKDRRMIIFDSVQSPKADEDLERFVGERRGIQGHQNSCYLDSTLFAMYAFTSVFDDLILEECTDRVAAEIVRIMALEIIYPLRENGKVTFDPVMKLRKALDELNKVKGLTHAEQDPEEFLNLLFKHVLKVPEPFIQLKRPSGVATEFFLQIFVEKSEQTLFTMKELLFKSMKESKITFKEAPQRLILQLPRYGKQFKIYDRVYPELHLNVSDLCADYIPQGVICGICGAQPVYQCMQCGSGDSVFRERNHYYCSKCNDRVHMHKDRSDHHSERIDTSNLSTRTVSLELLSVVCIEKSHYVSFNRHGKEWFFFDSMADRTDDGYNIPSVVECSFVGEGLQDVEALRKKDATKLPPLLRRLINDASICIYVDPVVAMY